jgi:hypothetical protein
MYTLQAVFNSHPQLFYQTVCSASFRFSGVVNVFACNCYYSIRQVPEDYLRQISMQTNSLSLNGVGLCTSSQTPIPSSTAESQFFQKTAIFFEEPEASSIA